MKEKYGFVYIWYDSARSKQKGEDKIKRWYIGCHWGSEDDGYICSSNWMRDAYRRRPQDFKRRIISKVYKRDEIFEEEYKWLTMIRQEELGKKYYNLQKYLLHWSSDLNTMNIVSEKLSIALSGEKHPCFGKHLSDETRKKIGLAHKGRIHNEESRKNMSEGQKKRFATDVPWNKGIPATVETLKKISEANKGKPSWNKGKKMSEETKKKISESKSMNFSEDEKRKEKQPPKDDIF